MSKDDDNIENREFTGGKILAGIGGAGLPTPADLRQRAEELAKIDGLTPQDVDDRYLEQARQELMGDEIAPDDVLPEADELAAGDDVLGESGRHVPNMGPSDENTVGEKLVAEGMDEALHEEMREGSRKLDRENRDLEPDDAEND